MSNLSINHISKYVLHSATFSTTIVLTLVGIIVSDWWYIWHYADGVGTIVADLSVPDPPLSHFGF